MRVIQQIGGFRPYQLEALNVRLANAWGRAIGWLGQYKPRGQGLRAAGRCAWRSRCSRSWRGCGRSVSRQIAQARSHQGRYGSDPRWLLRPTITVSDRAHQCRLGDIDPAGWLLASRRRSEKHATARANALHVAVSAKAWTTRGLLLKLVRPRRRSVGAPGTERPLTPTRIGRVPALMALLDGGASRVTARYRATHLHLDGLAAAEALERRRDRNRDAGYGPRSERNNYGLTRCTARRCRKTVVGGRVAARRCILDLDGPTAGRDSYSPPFRAALPFRTSEWLAARTIAATAMAAHGLSLVSQRLANRAAPDPIRAGSSRSSTFFVGKAEMRLRDTLGKRHQTPAQKRRPRPSEGYNVASTARSIAPAGTGCAPSAREMRNSRLPDRNTKHVPSRQTKTTSSRSPRPCVASAQCQAARGLIALTTILTSTLKSAPADSRPGSPSGHQRRGSETVQTCHRPRSMLTMPASTSRFPRRWTEAGSRCGSRHHAGLARGRRIRADHAAKRQAPVGSRITTARFLTPGVRVGPNRPPLGPHSGWQRYAEEEIKATPGAHQ